MEMEMGMDSLSFYPPPSSSGGQQAFSSSNCHYPPYAATAAATANNKGDVDLSLPPPQARQKQRAAVGRKDRHSKISTAGGMRDRRMRLSLDVAGRFFWLQDKLGFDRASKTVQWLLDMSTAGIDHLAASMSVSMWEEDGSGSVLLDSNDHVMAADAETNSCKMPTTKGRRRRAGRRSNNGAPALLPDKESRAKARQRARERTMERNRLRSSSVAAVAAEQAPAPAPAPARKVILPVVPSFGSYYEEQEPWELGGVVFARPRLH